MSVNYKHECEELERRIEGLLEENSVLAGRAEKAERERDEALATAMYAVQSAQMLSNAKNESEADEATDVISTLDASSGPSAMATLRAKHWREAAVSIQNNYNGHGFLSPFTLTDHLVKRADAIERGE